MNFLEKQLEDPARFAWIKRMFYVALVAVAVAEAATQVFQGGHGHFWFEDIYVFGWLYGLVSCLAIILVSKLIGKFFLMRREDYYDS